MAKGQPKGRGHFGSFEMDNRLILVSFRLNEFRIVQVEDLSSKRRALRFGWLTDKSELEFRDECFDSKVLNRPESLLDIQFFRLSHSHLSFQI